VSDGGIWIDRWTWSTTTRSTPCEPICFAGWAKNSEAAAAYGRAAAMTQTDAERDFLRLGGRGSR
jgi:hypothetical protein